MTLQEYFLQNQPINDELENETYYKYTQSIIFDDNMGHYAQIKIAHIGDNLWAFGWQIADGESKRMAIRGCTPQVTTKGDIHKLIYGMTKVLQRQLNLIPCPTKKIRDLIDNAISEANAFYQPNNKIVQKITI